MEDLHEHSKVKINAERRKDLYTPLVAGCG
jgi:hypothetical protein